MTPATAWRILDIAATTDGKAIRRAYAAKLRAIDPDKDREAFSALREARDKALTMTARMSDNAQEAETLSSPADATDGVEIKLQCLPLPLSPPIITAGSGDISAPPPRVVEDWRAPLLLPDFRPVSRQDDAIDLALPRRSKPEGRISPAADPNRFDQALYTLLYPDPHAEEHALPMTPAEVAEARSLIDRVRADAHGSTIDHHARAESWLAQILAGAWPRSHPLLDHAASLFGWNAREGQIDVPSAIRYINGRLASERFADAVRQKTHPLYSAWRQLSKPTRTGQSRAVWWQGNKIDTLLTTIRRDHPEVEDRLDWHRVALWEAHRARPIRWWPIIVGVTLGLRIVIALYHPSSETVSTPGEVSSPVPLVAVAPRVPGGLGDINADIKAALLATLGPDITRATLKTRAPLVLQLFESNWRLGIDMGRTRTQYVKTMIDVIQNRYVLLARQAGGEHLIALQRQRLQEERQLKGEHWRECAEIGTHGGLADPVLLSPDMRTANQETIAKLILAMPANPERPAPDETFAIPGKIVRRTVEISGLTINQVSAAFQGNGTDREKCLTHIALLNAVLDADAGSRSKLITHI